MCKSNVIQIRAYRVENLEDLNKVQEDVRDIKEAYLLRTGCLGKLESILESIKNSMRAKSIGKDNKQCLFVNLKIVEDPIEKPPELEDIAKAKEIKYNLIWKITFYSNVSCFHVRKLWEMRCDGYNIIAKCDPDYKGVVKELLKKI